MLYLRLEKMASLEEQIIKDKKRFPTLFVTHNFFLRLYFADAFCSISFLSPQELVHWTVRLETSLFAGHNSRSLGMAKSYGSSGYQGVSEKVERGIVFPQE